MSVTAAARSAKRNTKLQARSRMSNGSKFLANADGRSTWARRFRDLISLHLKDLDGSETTSEAERSIIRRAAGLTVELERMDGQFAVVGAATVEELDIYQRTANSLRRLLESVGIDRRPRDVTPTLAAYVKNLNLDADTGADA